VRHGYVMAKYARAIGTDEASAADFLRPSHHRMGVGLIAGAVPDLRVARMTKELYKQAKVIPLVDLRLIGLVKRAKELGLQGDWNFKDWVIWEYAQRNHHVFCRHERGICLVKNH
jgi:hypothetical protein